MDLPNTKISLARPDYQESCTKLFSSLLNSAEYSDVTLACEDGAFIHGHKFLLCAASSHFRLEILMFTKNEKYLEYLKKAWQPENYRLLMAGESGSQVFHVQASSDQVPFCSHLSLSFQKFCDRVKSSLSQVHLLFQFIYTGQCEVTCSYCSVLLCSALCGKVL